MLNIHDVSISYDGHIVLNHVSLTVDRGEVVCLRGESGCGKTSLLGAVMGFVDYEGLIEVDGMPVTEAHVDYIRHLTAYVPQELMLPQEQVRDMVTLPFSLRANRHVKIDDARLLAEWEQLGLSADLLDRGVQEISGGQRQRIMLSVAALLDKPLMLIDEPTSALDHESAQLVIDYFRRVSRQHNVAVLAVSHHEEFSNQCDRVVNL